MLDIKKTLTKILNNLTKLNSLIYTEEKTLVDNLTVTKSSYSYDTISIAKTGYTPIGIVSVRMENATSGGTYNTYCLLHSFQLTGTSMFYLVRNVNTSYDAKIKILVRVLYTKN